LAIFPLESSSSVEVLSRRQKLDIATLADPQGKLNEQLNLHTLPVHIYLDQKGIVKNLVGGDQTQKQLEQNLIN
jgi:hypothetical protein